LEKNLDQDGTLCVVDGSIFLCGKQSGFSHLCDRVDGIILGSLEICFAKK
jgi:hypothetical protein